MKQVKITKYNKDPKRVGDEIVVEIQPSKGPKAPAWFVNWNKTQFEPLKNTVETLKFRLDKLEKNDQIIFDILKRNNLK
ncbi:MAG: hypothetical protein LBP70_01415 [Mycoplasmataceae bacterium]|nr:hypothetical protein [Mycoplasmataceae bacterium]